jgi:hypothetical protein
MIPGIQRNAAHRITLRTQLLRPSFDFFGAGALKICFIFSYFLLQNDFTWGSNLLLFQQYCPLETEVSQTGKKFHEEIFQVRNYGILFFRHSLYNFS